MIPSCPHRVPPGRISGCSPSLRLLLLLVLSLGVALTASSCGYRFEVEGPGPTIGRATQAAELPATAPTLAVLTFDNASSEPNLEIRYTAYTRREFASGSGTRVITDPGSADLILRGQIVWVLIPTLAFNLTQGTQESRVTVLVRGRVEDGRTKNVVWDQMVTHSSEFFITRDLQFNRALQARALEQAGMFAAQDLATRFLHFLQTEGLPSRESSGPVPVKSP